MPSPIFEIEAIAPLLISYENTQRVIHRWKETGGTDLRRALFLMSECLKFRLLEQHFFAVVPIPQNQLRSVRRGHESALEVARFFAKELDLPILHLLELKDERVERQASRNRFDRAFSENPFQLSYDVPWDHSLRNELESRVYRGVEVRLLIVDDLITTGTTLGQAASVIKELLPRSRCMAGALGFRPKRKKENPKNGLSDGFFTPPAE